uniref:Putative necrosis-and ethylene-inducing protein n=1 Tax=Moniliophthora roreri TaxID=221103 RepID=A0A0W0G792_MONRR
MQFRNLFTTILLGISGIGRRHDWEGAVVSLDLRTNHINDGVTASAYGHWRKYPNPDGANVDGTHVKLQYSAEPVINSHAIDITDKSGDLPTLAQVGSAWGSCSTGY